MDSSRPERYWYAGRAVAESVKTITWRYISRAEPFQNEDNIAKNNFKQSLKMILEQNRDVCSKLTDYADEEHFTEAMNKYRRLPLEERKKNYSENRVKNQRIWYAKKAKFNKKKAFLFSFLLFFINSTAVVLAIFLLNYLLHMHLQHMK